MANHVDAISWHDYPAYDPEKYYKPELTSIESDILSICRIALEVTGKDLKLLGPEGGFMSTVDDILGHAYANTTLALLAKAAGAEQHIYFFLADYTYEPGMGIMSNLDAEHYANAPRSFFVRKASPKPEFPMIRQVNDVVDYADLVARSDSPGDAQNIRSHVYRSRENAMNTLIVWDPTDQNRTIQLNIGQGSVQIADVFGSTQTVPTPSGVLRLPIQRHPTCLVGVPANVLSTN